MQLGVAGGERIALPRRQALDAAQLGIGAGRRLPGQVVGLDHLRPAAGQAQQGIGQLVATDALAGQTHQFLQLLPDGCTPRAALFRALGHLRRSFIVFLPYQYSQKPIHISIFTSYARDKSPQERGGTFVAAPVAATSEKDKELTISQRILPCRYTSRASRPPP
ncbi:hypothetical protein D9M71_534080 [compost metagenome]